MSNIQPKIKPCKGVTPAKGYGCGLPSLSRKHGLSDTGCRCYQDWLLNSDSGKEKMNRSIISGKSRVEKHIAQSKLANTRKTSEHKRDLLSVDGYRKKYVQPVINEIARLIDFEQPCIATGNYGKMSGGHYFSTGSNRTLTYNLHNLHIQSFESNVHKSGDPINYRHGLIKIYGNDYFEFIESLQQTPALKLNKTDLRVIHETAKAIRLRLKNDPKVFSPTERIQLRNQVNIELGIYADPFAEFKQ